MQKISNNYSSLKDKLTLGKKVVYSDSYDASLLQSVPRILNRAALNLDSNLPFTGVDIWNGYEISWLNNLGKPIVVVGEFIFPCTSVNLVESKSFKLYLNGFNQTKFLNLETVTQLMQKDLSQCVQAEVIVKLTPIEVFKEHKISAFAGTCLDLQEIAIDTYNYDPNLLNAQLEEALSNVTADEIVTETVYSNLLKSNCLITSQPDWGSVQISYTGPKISHANLLRYIISFRQHQEFHEQCVERIFVDLLKHCGCINLSVYARYTRRGGLDINPYRTNSSTLPTNIRQIRQ